jgi:delta8-fatty-acid desaturase
MSSHPYQAQIIELNGKQFRVNPEGKDIGGGPIHDCFRCEVIDKKKEKYVGVNGKWYDVTHFIPIHPGGDIIKEYIGRDCSSAFLMNHSMDVLERRASKKTYDLKAVNPDALSLEEVVYRKLERWFRENDFFEPDLDWLWKRVAIHFFHFIALFWLAMYCESSIICRIIVGTLLGLFWTQSGFLLHDFEHCQHFQDRSWDHFFGAIAGVGFGVSAKWWRFEHFEHHTFTNTYVKGIYPCDPQMMEDFWIVGKEPGTLQLEANALNRLLLPFNHLVFVPLMVLFGRTAILTASFIREKTFQHRGIILCHWLWVICLAGQFTTWMTFLQVYFVGSFFQGLLAVQLELSHTAEPHRTKEEVKTGIIRRQTEVSLDITTSWYMDWFWGGLNLHTIHHLYPRMSRSKYREATDILKHVLKKYSIEHKETTPIYALWKTHKHMKELSNFMNKEMENEK